MKKYTQEELNTIIENHQHWLRKDCDGWEKMKADLNNVDLRYANLRYVDLRFANLKYANLSNADLRFADLSNTDLTDANLKYADLRFADLSNADLRYVDLTDANLTDANLKYADLSNADLTDANLKYSDLTDANLKYADLRFADLSNADLTDANLKYSDLTDAKNIPFIPYVCPDTGSFIGYKKVNRLIVELEIPSDASRCSATGRKCRCDKAKVLSIQNCDKNVTCGITEVASNYDRNFIYRVGEIVEEPNFDENRWNECARGIHFFINRQEAVEY